MFRKYLDVWVLLILIGLGFVIMMIPFLKPGWSSEENGIAVFLCLILGIIVISLAILKLIWCGIGRLLKIRPLYFWGATAAFEVIILIVSSIVLRSSSFDAFMNPVFVFLFFAPYLSVLMLICSIFIPKPKPKNEITMMPDQNASFSGS